MENKINECLECKEQTSEIAYHVKVIHKMSYNNYVSKHNLPRVCHCGKELSIPKNTKVESGRGGGRTRQHCSPLCNQHANTWWRVYGLEPSDYWDTLEKQNGVCAICHQPPEDGDRQFAVDHEHVDGYENMTPEEKKKYFRGLLCIVCNRFRLAKIDLEIARKIVSYLESYHSKI